MPKGKNNRPTPTREAREKFTSVVDEAVLARMSDELNAEMGDDFVKYGDDVSGFWSFEHAPIFCIPRSAKVFDGKIEPNKPSMLIIAEATRPTAILRKGLPERDEDHRDWYLDVVKKGDLVGIWAKPGMRAIRDLCGTEVKMTYTGEKETGKPNPMKTFDVMAKRDAEKIRIPITEDLRDKAHGARVFLEDLNPVARNVRERNRPAPPPSQQAAQDEDFDPVENSDTGL